MEKKYIIFDAIELDKIDFDEVIENSKDTLRYNIDNTKTFIKWIGETPDCVNNLSNKSEPLTKEQILSILETEEWKFDK